MHADLSQDAFRIEQRDATLLFADLRGFTQLAAALEADSLACELLAHVMDCLTDAVIAHNGYVIDYFGDGLVAMWNAPLCQPQHAEQACSAALDMLVTLTDVADDWRPLLPSELRLGIGVHTGTMQLGNAGSTRQQKYGPRGPNVHIASRVEAATKELGLPFVATHQTIEQLGVSFSARRVCRAQMPGISTPTDLYAVHRAPLDARAADTWQLYGKALDHFEQGEYQLAVDLLSSIDARLSTVPAAFLSRQAERELGEKQRRRSTDAPAAQTGGVIAIRAK